MNINGLTDAMVKCFLLPDRSSSSKKKTGVIKNNLNPVWEEKFVYQQPVGLRELLEERVLEVTVWDHNKHGNDFIGGLHVGGTPGRAARHKKWMDSIGAEVSHWEAMVSRPGEWVEEWHMLRPSIVPREVHLSTPPPPFILPSLSTKPDESPNLPKHEVLNEAHPQPELSFPPEPVASVTGHQLFVSPADDIVPAQVQSPMAPLPTIQLEAGVQPKSEPASEVEPELAAKPEPSSHTPAQEFHEEEPKSKYQVTCLFWLKLV